MKNIKKISLVATLVGVIGLGNFAYASDFGTPVESLKEERQFKASMLENKKAILNERVSQGQITQEEADKILSEIEENMKNCDGTGNKGVGKKYGVGFGRGKGQGNGQGMKNGLCRGNNIK